MNDPLEVLRNHEHRSTRETTTGEGTAYCAWCEALEAVEQLIEAAREVASSKGSYGYPLHNETALRRLDDALAPFGEEQA